MGIEVRNGRLYLYSRVRVKGKLHSQYCGLITPERAAELRIKLATEKALRLHAKYAAQAVGQQAAVVVEVGADFDNLADQLFRVTMQISGYHLHRRSEWRKSKGEFTMPTKNALIADSDPLSDLNFLSPGEPKRKHAIINPLSDDPAVRKILAKAAAGDRASLPAVRKLLANPNNQRQFGDVADMARDRLIVAIAGDDLTVNEAVRLQVSEMQGKLMAESLSSGSFVEELAAVRVIHNWLALYCLETKFANQRVGTSEADEISRQMAQVERRYQASLKALATLRRLNRPALATQVNLATGPMVVNNAPSTQAVAGKIAGESELCNPVRTVSIDADAMMAIPDHPPTKVIAG
jgi:hypothetical protein